MSATNHTPKRIADYFFMVGLRDEDSLIPSDEEEEFFDDDLLDDDNSKSYASVVSQPATLSTSVTSTSLYTTASTHSFSTTGKQLDSSSAIKHDNGPARALTTTAVLSTGHGPSEGQQPQNQYQQQGHEQRCHTAPSKSTAGHGEVIPATNPLNKLDAASPAAATSTMTESHKIATVSTIAIATTDSSSSSSSSTISTTRNRSKSMAHSRPIIPVPERADPEPTSTAQQQQNTSPPNRPRQPRRSSAAAMIGPPRRVTTLSNVSHQSGVAGGVGVGGIGGNSGTLLQHKPNYRHVSAGTLFKSLQEGLEFEKTIEGIQEETETEHGSVASGSGTKGSIHSNRREQRPEADSITTGGGKEAMGFSYQLDRKQAQSLHDFKNFGKSAPLIRSRTKPLSPPPAASGAASVTTPRSSTPASSTRKRLSIIPKPDQEDIHPGDRTFTPLVTCRYPETNWTDSDPFPSFLPMSESEIEYAKAIKTKISRERRLMKSLQLQLREEKTLGRRIRQGKLEREISDTEEKLSLLEDQMRPWRGLFVEIEDAWMPRSIGLVSSIPYHYLLRDWLLAVVVACSGGIEHPGMSLSSMRLESYVKNLIHEVNLPPFGKLEIGITINNRVIYASRPALNSVPIVKNFSLFPLFRCLTAEDIVTVIEVILSEGKIIFLSSYLGMLTLASESFLYLLFPLYWQGVYIPILPSALMTCLQAPVPYIIGIDRKSRDPDFPPEDACVVDLDKGIIDVQLPPTPLPPRQRRKLIQSLEQYAPTSAIKRSPATHNPALGPPVYVQEAFPHSRLTLFCGVSRAPRWNRRVVDPSFRPLPAVPGGPGDRSTVHGDPRVSSATNSSSISSVSTSASREINLMSGASNSSGNANGHVKKSTTLESLLLTSVEQQQRVMSHNLDSRTSLSTVGGMVRSTSEDTLDQTCETASRISKHSIAPSDVMQDVSPLSHHSTSESFKSNSRKVLSPARARANLLETSKKQDNNIIMNGSAHTNQFSNSATMPPSYPNSNIQRHNSRHSTHMTSATINTNYDGPGLTHRASFTSIDSSSSSVISKSPISTMTTNTMASINGPSFSNNIRHSQHNGYLDDDGYVGQSNGNGSTEQEKVAPITIEGHVLLPVSAPASLSLMNGRCGICTRTLAPHNEVYRCEGCSLHVHAGCLDELLYPCVPRGFDESGVCWSVLQMWAGLLKGYRSGILAGAALQQQLQQQSFQQQQFQHQFHQQQQYQHGANGSSHYTTPRAQGHMKQPSNSGSEGEKENNGRERLSWASFQRWAGRSNTTVASSNGVGGSGGSMKAHSNNSRSSFNPEQSHQQQYYQQHPHHQQYQQQQSSPVSQRAQSAGQPLTRMRHGTEGSTHSDTVSFHRDVFMKGVDKEARPFMSVFTESQAFVQFVQDRVDRSPGDPEIMFFDEVIKAKINRSRFRLGKEETKFLDDPSYGVQGTVKAIPPSGDIQVYGKSQSH
ncbi:hypothetical protein FBU30_006904 [Linnemannia zychae]|nr:hypothetical protein FBU30_006904 [Linnemannia zychae]